MYKRQVQYYVWYALAYPEYGWAAHFGAYFACALMAADIMLVLPLFLLMMIGTVRFIRRYAQIFGVAVMALSLFIGVYGSVDGEMKEEAERYTICLLYTSHLEYMIKIYCGNNKRKPPFI